MSFFKKLFGFSAEAEISNYNKKEHEDNVPHINVETKTEESTPKQLYNSNTVSFENFFGVNLKNSPNENWAVIEEEYNGNNLIRTYGNHCLNNTYFSCVEAIVVNSNATNFFFKCPYSWEDAFDIYYLIERDLVHHGNYANIDAANKFRGNFDSYYDSFEWEIDGCKIRMSRDIGTGDIELGIWTSFCNEEFLGKVEEFPAQEPAVVEEAESLADIYDNEKTSFENFFGVNLKASPNESWNEGIQDIVGEKVIRNFTIYNIDNEYFSSASAKVIGDSATNFFFKCPYSWDVAFDIYYLIERDMVHGGRYANIDAADKFRGNFDTYYDQFDWDIDGCHIILSRDIYTGDIELSVWTGFYNNSLDNTSIDDDCALSGESDNELEEDSSPLPRKNFNVSLSGDMKTLSFLHDYLEEQLSGVASCFVVRAEGNIIQLIENDTFCEVYSFESDEISDYLNGRLGALGILNLNCDDLDDIEAEVFVIPAGDSLDDEAQNEALIHYEMDYLVDPVEMDYRMKTIVGGRMNLNLVGIQYRNNYEELIETLEEGMTVVLKPEPSNEFDPNALAFYYDGEIIGYLPKKDQPFAHIFLAKGQIEATICNVDEKWIDTEVIITRDMIDNNAYKESGVRFTKIESLRGGNRSRINVEFSEFVDSIAI